MDNGDPNLDSSHLPEEDAGCHRQLVENTEAASGEKLVQYNAIQYNAVQYNAVQYNVVQYNVVQYSTVQYSTVDSKSPEIHGSDLRDVHWHQDCVESSSESSHQSAVRGG